MTDKWTPRNVERRILAHTQLPIHTTLWPVPCEIVALRNDLRDAAAEVRRLETDNAVLEECFALLRGDNAQLQGEIEQVREQFRELETKGGKP